MTDAGVVTGEVIEGTAGVAVTRYEGALLQPAAALPEIADRFGQYRELCELLLEPEDWQPIGDRQFLKKSGWRKLATAMGVDLEQRRREVARSEKGGVIFAEFTYRATAPNGRFADAEGSCSASERRFTHPDHDVIATAETRAKSRACSDLFGLGALSAEEIAGEGENGGGVAATAGTSSPAPEGLVQSFRIQVRALARKHNRDEAWLRHRVVANATGGRTESSSDLRASEMDAVFAELVRADAAMSEEGPDGADQA